MDPKDFIMSQPVDATIAGIPAVWIARLASLYYFAFIYPIMFFVGLFETPKPLPASIAQSVLGDKPAAAE